MANFRIYTVQKGDTLWQIGKRFGVSAQALAEANHLSDPDSLCPGQRLIIPGASVIRYVVQPGDTLWYLARRFHTTVAEIIQLNQLTNPDLIYPGQILNLPVYGAAQ